MLNSNPKTQIMSNSNLQETVYRKFRNYRKYIKSWKNIFMMQFIYFLNRFINSIKILITKQNCNQAT